MQYSQAKSKEEKRNLFLVLFDYALHQINEARLISGASAYAFDEVQAVSSMLILADAPEAFYIVVKHGVDGIGQILMKSISGALSRSPNHGHLDLVHFCYVIYFLKFFYIGINKPVFDKLVCLFVFL